MDIKLKDFELIEKANLTTEVKFVTQTTVAALHYLKSLATQLGIPMEQITVEHIIHESSREDAKIREQQKLFADWKGQ